ncbi:MAG: TMEM43 family protein [Nevskia sp.]|nr:TMEM43 family protein [Nevskia sp.]
MDSVTEVSSSGVFSRLGQSLIGALIGLLLVPASVVLLYWNEGRAVIASTGLAQGQKQLVQAAADRVDPQHDGKLVHLSGALSATQPAQDQVFGMADAGQVVLRRKVEMYQWKESKRSHSSTAVGGTTTTTTTYDYNKVWSDEPIDSGQFHSSGGHGNPPMPLRSETSISQSAKLDAYTVDQNLLQHFKVFQPLAAQSAPAGYRAQDGVLYRGNDPAAPQVGDLRVSFSGVAPQTASVVAEQSSGALTPFSTANGYTIAMIVPGTVDAAMMFAQTRAEESQLTWILRGVGFVLMMVGFMLGLRPFSVLGSILPFVGGLIEAGAFFFALAVSAPLTLLVIAIAWVAHRPLLGGALIAAAALVFYLGHRNRPRKQGAAAAA